MEQNAHVGHRRIDDTAYEFTVWAPKPKSVELELLDSTPRRLPMDAIGRGLYRLRVDDVKAGNRYQFVLNGDIRRPDPVSHFQSESVHGPSTVVDHDAFRWTDHGYTPPPFGALVIYELHVGTFTPEGTFAAAMLKIDYLVELGVSAVEIMPVAAFPGERNWGYDGVFPYSVHQAYGGPDALKAFVDACHSRGMAVIMDVVYNHLGPEGNYLRDFGPYFTNHYHTPWGDALNFDGAGSDGVRNFFLQNALHWLGLYHIDGLRLDAVHAIYDQQPIHILQELAQVVSSYGKACGFSPYLIAESNLNDPRLTSPLDTHGLGMDATWSDDFHHSVHTLLTGERNGYYMDFGSIDHLGTAVRDGFSYQGEYAPSRDHAVGAPCRESPATAFVNSIQTHDQVGNRIGGERLAGLVGFESLKLAAGLLLVTPCIPMLFMGEEFGEDHPFHYFVSHTDDRLIEAVRKGRAREFKSFKWKGTPIDPQAESTFIDSKLDWSKTCTGNHAILLEFYKRLLQLRRALSTLSWPQKNGLEVTALRGKNVLAVVRQNELASTLGLFNFSTQEQIIDAASLSPTSNAIKILDSADPVWSGPSAQAPNIIADGITLPSRSMVLYHGEKK
ncbi:malto-oligosyltrehalose trehalohydrolase [Desulfovibrio inopinatus]|uniref:malto-oligosyltrehalose trehalohydrolase n=1 Tax=Desulfovibrio inopinatus TaxID=102109 RepID=UPI000418D43D|nr:malto-oligosyltrehalose trehalohydrolase [Desulfovibrio inopinatus]